VYQLRVVLICALGHSLPFSMKVILGRSEVCFNAARSAIPAAFAQVGALFRLIAEKSLKL